jgi:hypothetical protein
MHRYGIAAVGIAGFIAGTSLTAMHCASTREPPLVPAFPQPAQSYRTLPIPLPSDDCQEWDYRYCSRLLHLLDVGTGDARFSWEPGT